MSDYNRQHGDNLLCKDKRLKYKWRWSRIASRVPLKETKTWTHFQCSMCEIGDWKLESTQWGSGDTVSYEATISYKGDQLEEHDGFNTRLNAQIGAEKLLRDWIQKQYKEIVNNH